jgi:hypothetical protein
VQSARDEAHLARWIPKNLVSGSSPERLPNLYAKLSSATLFKQRLTGLNGLDEKRQEVPADLLEKRRKSSIDVIFEIADNTRDVGLIKDRLLLSRAKETIDLAGGLPTVQSTGGSRPTAKHR